MQIVDLAANRGSYGETAAVMLFEEFGEISPDAWPDLESARGEFEDCVCAGYVCLGAVESGGLRGWVGARPQYGSTGWELHPLVVGRAWRGRGIGSALLRELELVIRSRGGITVYLGSDDEDGRTSLAAKDLYPALFREIEGISNRGRHPYEFYLKNGYLIVGAIPDANGPGKPDILMAKRVAAERGRPDSAEAAGGMSAGGMSAEAPAAWRIREAGAGDLSRLAEIHVYGWRMAYAAFMSEAELYARRQVKTCMDWHARNLAEVGQDCLVYEEGGIVKGFALVNDCRDEDLREAFELSALYIEPAYKGRGIGSRLLVRFEELAAARGRQELALWVLAANARARAFYEKAGFRPDGAAKTIDGLGLEELRYRKRAR